MAKFQNAANKIGETCRSRRVEKIEFSPAKFAIILEWNTWAQEYPSQAKIADGLLFFNYLQKYRHDLLLDFKSPGDKWTTVHSWLLSARKVKR